MHFDELPQLIKEHLKKLIDESDKGSLEEAKELFAEAWSLKQEMFEAQTKNLQLEPAETVKMDDERGILILTYSGSILSISPKIEVRNMEYTSIDLRTDVPKIIRNEDITFKEDLEVGNPAIIEGGTIKRTSPVFLIMVCSESIPFIEQEKRIREGAIYLTNSFLKVNKELNLSKNKTLEQFTMKSMARYIAKMNNVTGVVAKQILDDFIMLIESGMLLGEKVPIGRIGRLYLKKRDAQKARVVRHPGTGDDIIIEAKPETHVPKISFSKYIKEKATDSII